MALKDFKHPPQLPPFIAVKDDPMSVLKTLQFLAPYYKLQTLSLCRLSLVSCSIVYVPTLHSATKPGAERENTPRSSPSPRLD